jgi:hypothetical protein
MKSYFDVKHAFFVWISKSGIELFKKHFKVVEQGWLMFIKKKGVNQARVVFDNKVPMNPTWIGPIGYHWGWSQMTKRTWLTKLWNFECVPSNLSGRLIHDSFVWGCVVKTHPKEVKAWLVCKWVTNFQSDWFSYSKFLKIARIPSIDVNMFMNTVKYDTNKRWVIHNFNQQEVCNLWLFENLIES